MLKEEANLEVFTEDDKLALIVGGKSSMLFTL
jgi:hypothetical protein